MQKNPAILFLVLAPALWAGNFVVGRAVHSLVEPFALNYLRWFVAGMVSLPVLLSDRQQIVAALRTHLLPLLLLTGSGIVGFNTLLYSGLSSVPAGASGLLFGITPLLILLLARLSRQRRIAPLQVAGTLVSLLGIWFIAGEIQGTGALSEGAALILGASLCWALYSVGLARAGVPLPGITCLALTIWIGLLAMTPALLLGMARLPPAETIRQIAAPLAFLGLGPSLLGFFSWQTGIAALGASAAGPFLHLVPAFSILLSMTLLGESYGPAALAGLGLVTAGVTLARWQR